MTPIITLTLSPAFDLQCLCPDLAINRENLATVQSRDAGGKGINISRALTANKTQSLAITLLGAQNAAEFEQRLRDEGIVYKSITLLGRIRENVTLHTAEGRETRISFSGFSATDEILEPLEEMIVEEIGAEPIFYLTLTGRVPDGMTMPALIAFLCRMKDRGARIVLDSKSFSTKDVLEVRPWLIKPNREELAALVGRPLPTLSDVVAAARELMEKGARNALITLGRDGAILCTAEGCWYQPAPDGKVIGTVGAGDSTVAGFMRGYIDSDEWEEALRVGVACGSATAFAQGLATLKEIRAVLKRLPEMQQL